MGGRIRWFKPETQREHCYLHFSNPFCQKRGAFLVRKASKSENYCLTILADPQRWPDSDCLKHILIHIGIDDKYRICMGHNERPFLFDSVFALVKFYMEHSVGMHYQDYTGLLVDVFTERGRYEGLRLPRAG